VAVRHGFARCGEDDKRVRQVRKSRADPKNSIPCIRIATDPIPRRRDHWHPGVGIHFALVVDEALAMTITRILVPTDFSGDAEAAFRYALDLAKPFGAIVELLHVVEDPLAAGMWSAEFYTAEIAGLNVNLVKDAESRLRGIVGDAKAPIRLVSEVRTGPAFATILDTAREHHTDLIVMGTKGRTGLAHLLMGSVAERVVRLAPCPVLTVRQPAAVGGAAKKDTATAAA
jgi:nucleotide-binding universal stress UspA family protein